MHEAQTNCFLFLLCLVCCSRWVLSCSVELWAARASCPRPSSPTSGCCRFTWTALSWEQPANSPTTRWLNTPTAAHFTPGAFLLRQYLNCRWSLFTFWAGPNGFFSEWSHKHPLRLSPPANSHRWPTSTLYTSALLKSADHSVLSLGAADVWMQRGGPGCGCSPLAAPRPPQPQPTDGLPLSNWRSLSSSHLITVPIIWPVKV